MPVFADTRAAWVGPAPDGSGVPLRIEAAAFAGRPVYFRIIAPWTPATESAGVPIETVLFGLLFFLLVGVGAVLARRNLQGGKSDQQGRRRVAATVGLLLLAAQLLEAHHTFTGAEVFVVIGALSWALFVAAFTWLSYVALEPYVRRHWPHALIGWTRLLAGRWRDRRVGRDLLIGAIVGLAAVVIDRVAAALAGWRTGDSVLWRVDLDALSSGGTLAASFLRSLALSTAFSIDLLFLLLLLRLFLPRPWLASMLAVAILVGLNLPLVHRPARAAAAGDRFGDASRAAVDALRPARRRHLAVRRHHVGTRDRRRWIFRRSLAERWSPACCSSPRRPSSASTFRLPVDRSSGGAST